MNAVLSDALHQGTAAQMDMYEKTSLRKTPLKAKADD
jgi:hypothetical protein